MKKASQLKKAIARLDESIEKVTNAQKSGVAVRFTFDFTNDESVLADPLTIRVQSAVKTFLNSVLEEQKAERIHLLEQFLKL